MGGKKQCDEVNLCLWSLRLFLITEEDCDFHPAAIFPPHVQNVLFLTVVSLFFSPLSTDRCSFRRSSSFVCLRHGRRIMEALCLTSIRSETPALNFRWDSTIPLNAEFRICCNLCLEKKTACKVNQDRFFQGFLHWILCVMSVVRSVLMVSFGLSDRKCRNILLKFKRFYLK